MINYHSNSNAALLSSHGTSAYETGTQAFSSNALRFYNEDGKRRRKPSTTSAMRMEMAAMLMNGCPAVRSVKIHDSGIGFSARIRFHSGRTFQRKAYNLQNLYGILCESLEASA